MNSTRTLIAVVFVVTAVAVFRPSSVETQGPPPVNQRLAILETQVATLQGQVAALLLANATLQSNITAEAAARGAADTALQTQIDNVATVPQNLLDLANYVSVDSSTINDLVGPHIIFSGANVHIQNGLGATESTTGLGNLIVGYNSTYVGVGVRSGSHNIVVGRWHSYSSYGGLVVGSDSIINGPFASVSGGVGNRASGFYASVSGGSHNIAENNYASVSGGLGNKANQTGASVSGGAHNIASGEFASVSGGGNNTAGGEGATVSGGTFNSAMGYASTISGGTEQGTTVQFSHLP